LKRNQLRLNKIKETIKDPLFYNGFFLFISYALSAPLSIVFYKIAVLYYSSEVFGVAVSIISLINWVGFFSRFGINMSVRRFFPETNKKDDLINTSIVSVSLSGLIVGISALLISVFLVSDFDFLKEDFLAIFALILMIVLNNIITILDAVITSTRKSVVLSIKQVSLIAFNIVFVILLAFLNASGYIYGLAISTTIIFIGFFLTVILLYKKYKFRIKFDFSIFKRISRFSISNYYISIVANFRLLIPTILLFLASPESAAYFSIVMVAVNLLYFALSSFGTSFMVESVHDPKSFRKNIIKTMKLTFIILIPMLVGAILLGKVFLMIYGPDYVEYGYMLLVFCLLTTIPGSIKLIYMNMCYVTEKMKGPMIFQTIESVLTLIGFLILFKFLNLTSFGVSWLSVIFVLSIVMLVLIIRLFSPEKLSQISNLMNKIKTKDDLKETSPE